MSDTDHDEIDNVMRETRMFPPSAEFSAKSHIGSVAAYEAIYAEAESDPEKFWGDLARQELHWFEPFETVFQRGAEGVEWFREGKTNLSYNCLDAHVANGLGDRVAILWEGEPGDERRLTYRELLSEVCRFANVLKQLGVGKGDRVSVYMPMTPELAIAMLACARIGAIHSVIFGGFSAEAIADRNNDAQAKLVITADGGWRRGKRLELKATVDQALEKSPSVEKCLVLQRTGHDIAMRPGRDVWLHEMLEQVSDDCPAEPLEAEAPLFILYTSGSTGKPKGIKHTTAGYGLYTKMTFRWVFDHRDEDVYWCTADCGWITGHSYIVYGPLANAATIVMYEGAPNAPDESRFWQIVEKYKVSIFYTAPTAIRAFIKWGDEHVEKHDLSSLRLLGTVGEGINPEAWMWYHHKIGGGRCPIVDTWWQTETGGIMMSPLPGAIPTKPGSCTRPLPGVIPKIMHTNGSEITARNQGGMLCISQPWPGMLRGIWGDEARHQEQYWTRVPG
ncbi:MAG: acetate--CoA ligase, partial [Planctomycetales bacterium]|nr:acetate--CoA ligase [Planctomycetales bacterium]